MCTENNIDKLIQIKRYNRGFGTFGPLEQASDGELAKFSDVMDLFVEVFDHASIMALNQYSVNRINKDQLKKIDHLEMRLSQAMKQNFKLEDELFQANTKVKRNAIMRDLFAQLLIVTTITAVLLHFNGGI